MIGERGKKMPKYIERDSFIEWLKNIPLKDLSDGIGLCRIIMEDDFKSAIKNMPESIIHDYEEVVRCKNCKYKMLTRGSVDVKSYSCDCRFSPCRGRIVEPQFFCFYGEEEQKHETD